MEEGREQQPQQPHGQQPPPPVSSYAALAAQPPPMRRLSTLVKTASGMPLPYPAPTQTSSPSAPLASNPNSSSFPSVRHDDDGGGERDAPSHSSDDASPPKRGGGGGAGRGPHGGPPPPRAYSVGGGPPLPPRAAGGGGRNRGGSFQGRVGGRGRLGPLDGGRGGPGPRGGDPGPCGGSSRGGGRGGGGRGGREIPPDHSMMTMMMAANRRSSSSFAGDPSFADDAASESSFGSTAGRGGPAAFFPSRGGSGGPPPRGGRGGGSGRGGGAGPRGGSPPPPPHLQRMMDEGGQRGGYHPPHPSMQGGAERGGRGRGGRGGIRGRGERGVGELPRGGGFGGRGGGREGGRGRFGEEMETSHYMPENHPLRDHPFRPDEMHSPAPDPMYYEGGGERFGAPQGGGFLGGPDRGGPGRGVPSRGAGGGRISSEVGGRGRDGGGDFGRGRGGQRRRIDEPHLGGEWRGSEASFDEDGMEGPRGSAGFGPPRYTGDSFESGEEQGYIDETIPFGAKRGLSPPFRAAGAPHPPHPDSEAKRFRLHDEDVMVGPGGGPPPPLFSNRRVPSPFQQDPPIPANVGRYTDLDGGGGSPPSIRPVPVFQRPQRGRLDEPYEEGEEYPDERPNLGDRGPLLPPTSGPPPTALARHDPYDPHNRHQRGPPRAPPPQSLEPPHDRHKSWPGSAPGGGRGVPPYSAMGIDGSGRGGRGPHPPGGDIGPPPSLPPPKLDAIRGGRGRGPSPGAVGGGRGGPRGGRGMKGGSGRLVASSGRGSRDMEFSDRTFGGRGVGGGPDPHRPDDWGGNFDEGRYGGHPDERSFSAEPDEVFGGPHIYRGGDFRDGPGDMRSGRPPLAQAMRDLHGPAEPLFPDGNREPPGRQFLPNREVSNQMPPEPGPPFPPTHQPPWHPTQHSHGPSPHHGPPPHINVPHARGPPALRPPVRSPRDSQRPPSPRGSWGPHRPVEMPHHGPQQPHPHHPPNPSPPPFAPSFGTLGRSTTESSSGPYQRSTISGADALGKPAADAPASSSGEATGTSENGELTVSAVVEPPRTPPPEPKDPTPSLLATTRMMDLEAQMEYAFSKHMQLILEQQKLRARYNALESMGVGMEAFQVDYDGLLSKAEESKALYGDS